jgi:hypothetical protein
MKPDKQPSIDSLIETLETAGLTIIEQHIIHNAHCKNGEVTLIANTEAGQHYFFKYIEAYTPQAYNGARTEYRQYLHRHPETTVNGYIITPLISKGL